MITKAKVRDDLIVTTVTGYFKADPVKVFEGKVTTGMVIQAVREALNAHGFRWTIDRAGEVYDAIRDTGPEGEDDVRWLLLYGGSQVVFHQQTPMSSWTVV